MSKYHKGDKFVIEIDEVFRNDADDFIHEEELYRIRGFKNLVFDGYGLDKLQKYDEDMIPYDVAYNKGLEDAWELAKKIASNPSEGGFSLKELIKIFGISLIKDIFKKYSAQEALAKLEAYEKEQAEIKVGDVVTIFPISGGEYNAVVVRATNDMDIDAIYSDGITTCNVPPELYKKTGKHIDIQSVLEQIGGGSDV